MMEKGVIKIFHTTKVHNMKNKTVHKKELNLTSKIKRKRLLKAKVEHPDFLAYFGYTLITRGMLN